MAFCCTINNGFAQVNLVPNYSFEIYTTCPSNGSQISLAAPWTGPTNEDADLYNGCSSINVGVPVNDSGFGFQYPHTGIGYAGIFAYNMSGLNCREYIQVQLDTILQTNACYFVNFFVNLKGSWLRYAINNLGLHLSDTGFSYIAPAPSCPLINVIPQILKYNNPIISDTLNWVPISGIYVANGGEQFITIGNFFNDANTDTLVASSGTYPGAYYYIDDVSVIAITSSSELWQYNDTSVYVGDSVFIGQDITGLNCTWYDTLGNILADSVPGIYVSPTMATNYVVVENLCGNIRTDTITVTINYVGIEEWDSFKNITVYPNPSDGNFVFKLPKTGQESVQIKITDISGKEVYERNLQGDHGLFNFKTDLVDGTYLLYIRHAESLPAQGGNYVVKRIVIKK